MADALKTELAKRITAGEALMVIGTGISVAATAGDTLASWKGLIGNGPAGMAG